MKIKVRGRRQSMRGDREREDEEKCQRREIRRKEMRKLLLTCSDVLFTIHYPLFVIYSLHTHSRVTALSFLTRTVCVCVCVCVFVFVYSMGVSSHSQQLVNDTK